MNILLLHGWGFDVSIWDGLVHQLSADKDIISCSAIDIKDWKSIANINAQIQSETMIIAWSLGGNLAVDLASKNQHINSLLLINYNPCFCKRDDWPFGIEIEKLQLMQNDLIDDKEKCFNDFYQWCCFGNRNSLKWLKQQNSFKSCQRSTEYLQDGLKRLRQDDQRQSLSQLDCDVTMLFSENDVLVPAVIEKYCAQLNSSIQSRQIAAASHLSPLLDRTEILDSLVELLK